MTVKELKEALSTFDDEQEIVIEAYDKNEDGYYYLKAIAVKDVIFNYDDYQETKVALMPE